MTGPITLPANPTANLQATTKQYVDGADAANAAAISTEATNRANAISGLLNTSAPFTISPTVPTVASSDNSNNAASTSFVQAVAANASSGLDPISPVAAAAGGSNVNLANPGFTSLDGVTLTSGTSRIGLIDQTAPAQNGVYLYNGSGAALTRTSDANVAADFSNRQVYFKVTSGSTYGGNSYVLQNPGTVTLGTTPLDFVLFDSVTNYTAGSGLTVSGNQISAIFGNTAGTIGDGGLLASTTATANAAQPAIPAASGSLLAGPATAGGAPVPVTPGTGLAIAGGALNVQLGTTAGTAYDGGQGAAAASTASTALSVANAALPASHLGAANGAARLDATSLLPQSELPAIPYANLPTGTASNTVAAGNDSRIVNAMEGPNALSEISALGLQPTALLALGTIAHVPTTAALESLPTTVMNAGAVIERDGNSAAGDTPAADYTYTPTACSLNVGAGIPGGQYPALPPASGGSNGCFNLSAKSALDARIFGGVPSTIATGLVDPNNYNATAFDNAITYSQILYGKYPSLIDITGGGYLYALNGTSIGVPNAKFLRLADFGLTEIGQGNGASCTAGMINVTGSTTIELSHINTDSGRYPISSFTLGVNGTVHGDHLTGQHWLGWCGSTIVHGTPANGSNTISVPGGTAGLNLANGMLSQDNTTFGIPDGATIVGIGANSITLSATAGPIVSGYSFNAPYNLVFGNPTATVTGTTNTSAATATAVLSGSSSSNVLTGTNITGVVPGMFVQGNPGLPGMDEVMSVTSTSVTLYLPPTATITSETVNFAFDPHVIQVANTSGLTTFMVSRGNTAAGLPDRSWIASIIPNQYIVVNQAATSSGAVALNFYADPNGLFTGVDGHNTGGTYDQINFQPWNSVDQEVSDNEDRYGAALFYSGDSNDILVTNALFNNGVCAVELDSNAGGIFGTHWEVNNDNFNTTEPQACAIGMANGNGGMVVGQLNLGGGTVQHFLTDNLSADIPKIIIASGQYVSSSNITETPNAVIQPYNFMVGALGYNIQSLPMFFLIPGRSTTQMVAENLGPGTWQFGGPNDVYMPGASLEGVNINPYSTPGTGAFSTLSTTGDFTPGGYSKTTTNLAVAAAGTTFGTSTILSAQVNLVTSGTGGVRFQGDFGYANTVTNVSGAAINLYLSGGALLTSIPNGGSVEYQVNSATSATLISQNPIASPASHGQLVGVQLFSATSCAAGCTYTPDAGTNQVIVEAVGSGAGSGGAVATSTAQSSIGSGGGAGSYGKELFTTGFSGVTVTVASGGAAGAAGAAGTAGGTTSFGTLISCPGGLAGAIPAAKSAAALGGVSGKAAACTFGTGTILANVPGGTSLAGIVLTPGTFAQSGAGGSGPLGSGAAPVSAATQAGNAGAGYGAGASGGVNQSASEPAVAGANGSAGDELVYEYN